MTDDPFREPDRAAQFDERLRELSDRVSVLGRETTKKNVLRGGLTFLCALLPVVVIGVLFFLPSSLWTFARGMGVAVLICLTVLAFAIRAEIK